MKRWNPVWAMVPGLVFLVAGCDLYFGNGDEFNIPQPPDDRPPDFPGATCEDQSNDDFFPGPDSGPLTIGPTVQADDPPPPITGGTLAVSPDGTMVAASDPDRDQVYVISLVDNSLVHTVQLQEGDEPGRVVIDNVMHAHVSLRSGGAVATINMNAGTVRFRNEVCPAPRGIAIDDWNDILYVACHGGELIGFNPYNGQIANEHALEVGLHDVIVEREHIYVTAFRTAELLVLQHDGEEIKRMVPPSVEDVAFDPESGDRPVWFVPGVAWRTVAGPDGGVVMLHQRSLKAPVQIGRGGYGGDPCRSSVVHAAITPLHPDRETPRNAAINAAVLAVDFTLINGNEDAVVVAAGNGPGAQDFMFSPPVQQVPVNQPHRPFDCFMGQEFGFVEGQPIATESLADNTVIVQYREPAALAVYAPNNPWSPAIIPLSAVSREDTGHRVFHMNTGGGIACASCHPGGGTDARVWEFDCIGPRRTQSFQHGLLGTEPFHWDGDMNDLHKLMDDVFVGRMGGGQPNSAQMEAVANWLDTLRPPPRSAPRDPEAVTRGEALFVDPTIGCGSTCHSGAKLTNNESMDVGTGKAFQVPSLIGLADRAPYMHSGCAATLHDRFLDTECGRW